MAYEGPHPLPVPSGGTGDSSLTAFALLAGGITSTGAIQSVASGTAGQILQSNGSSALPGWINSTASGNLVLIGSQIASNTASISFNDTNYKVYLLIIHNAVPASNGAGIAVLLTTNSGSSYISTGYSTGVSVFIYNGAGYTFGSTTTSVGVGGGIDSSSAGLSTASWFTGFNGSQAFFSEGTYVQTQSATNSGGHAISSNSTTGSNGIKIAMGSGNIASGTFSLYGLLE